MLIFGCFIAIIITILVLCHDNTMRADEKKVILENGFFRDGNQSQVGAPMQKSLEQSLQFSAFRQFMNLLLPDLLLHSFWILLKLSLQQQKADYEIKKQTDTKTSTHRLQIVVKRTSSNNSRIRAKHSCLRKINCCRSSRILSRSKLIKEK